jgi:hypothetical protein
MGGNLLKTWNLPEKRISTIEYNRIKDELLNKFQQDQSVRQLVGPSSIQLVGSSRGVVAPSIRNKDTHGDLDIIVRKHRDTDIVMLWKGEQDFGKYLETEFGYKPFKNSNVFSFPYQGFQVDVTFHPVVEFEIAVDYSSWGDLGNIMGRVFHKMGLHFGHSGLSFWIRQGLFDNNLQWSDSDHIYDKVVLTRDMQEICAIGGFDYSRWNQGFDTEQDAFDFVVDSKYFDPDLFKLENLNHTNRTRNRKRGMYMRFMEYVADSNKVGEPFRSKHEYSLLMQCKYSHLQRAIDGFRLLYEVDKVIKEKVNGKLVMEWLDLSENDGKLVGQIMNKVRELDKYKLLEMTQATIIVFVIETHKQLINQ